MTKKLNNLYSISNLYSEMRNLINCYYKYFFKQLNFKI